ncbi:MAG: hypothetical protein LBR91_02025 [Puniceicoccales bacterium]|jgi:hypothetical protein|nr:hypothetical protein [Puniceicoccales bacterium]
MKRTDILKGGTHTNCVPHFDPKKVTNDTVAFNQFALPGMVNWVSKICQRTEHKRLHWRDVSLAVAHELDEFLKEHPKQAYELGPSCSGFGRNVLLPRIMNGEISVDSIPLDLIAILYVDDPFSNVASVIRVNYDDETGNNLLFQYMYNDTGTILSFRIMDFRHPETAKVECIGR